ncbi:hypothetical protein [Falsiroseomonas sp. E2-1-a20]|uniref:hypothetical protein n=1 Tax=Falsiroseomonas sp. E2-1-a20 TaxID=3239300 RepID=UPI003F2EFC1A
MRAAPGTIPPRRSRLARGGECATLEAVAAEFALLAQRRARLQRQLDLLGRQADAARGNLSRVESRLAALSGRMTLPDLRAAALRSGNPPPAAPARPRAGGRGALLEY